MFLEIEVRCLLVLSTVFFVVGLHSDCSVGSSLLIIPASPDTLLSNPAYGVRPT